MGLIIRSISTISKFYQHLCFNSRIDFNGLKYLYSVISVIDKRLPVNTKKWTLVGRVSTFGRPECDLSILGRVMFFLMLYNVVSLLGCSNGKNPKVKRLVWKCLVTRKRIFLDFLVVSHVPTVATHKWSNQWQNFMSHKFCWKGSGWIACRGSGWIWVGFC